MYVYIFINIHVFRNLHYKYLHITFLRCFPKTHHHFKACQPTTRWYDMSQQEVLRLATLPFYVQNRSFLTQMFASLFTSRNSTWCSYWGSVKLNTLQESRRHLYMDSQVPPYMQEQFDSWGWISSSLALFQFVPVFYHLCKNWSKSFHCFTSVEWN